MERIFNAFMAVPLAAYAAPAADPPSVTQFSSTALAENVNDLNILAGRGFN